MYILGISGGVRLGYHDIGAALLNDGKLVAAVEEERINRIKHSPGQLPQKSIYTVLESEKISITDVDILATHGITWGDVYDTILKDYFEGEFGFCPPIEKVHHHDAHAASAYYASGFNEAIVITMDGSGDGVSCEFCIGRDNEMEILQRFDRPNSLGIFYSMITQYCGFTRDSDEYKLMGLSSYGDRNKFDFSKIIYFENGELKLDTSYIKTIAPKQSQPTKQEMIYSEKLIDEFGPKRLKKQELSKHYKDIAASAQAHVEKVIIEMINFLHKKLA